MTQPPNPRSDPSTDAGSISFSKHARHKSFLANVALAHMFDFNPSRCTDFLRPLQNALPHGFGKSWGQESGRWRQSGCRLRPHRPGRTAGCLRRSGATNILFRTTHLTDGPAPDFRHPDGRLKILAILVECALANPPTYCSGPYRSARASIR